MAIIMTFFATLGGLCTPAFQNMPANTESNMSPSSSWLYKEHVSCMQHSELIIAVYIVVHIPYRTCCEEGAHTSGRWRLLQPVQTKYGIQR